MTMTDLLRKKRVRRAYLFLILVCACATLGLMLAAAFLDPHMIWLLLGLGFFSTTVIWVTNLQALDNRDKASE